MNVTYEQMLYEALIYEITAIREAQRYDLYEEL